MIYLQVFVYNVFVVCSWLHRHKRFSRTSCAAVGLTRSSSEHSMSQHRSIDNIGVLYISPALLGPIAVILFAVIVRCLFHMPWSRIREACAMWVVNVQRFGSVLPDVLLYLATRLLYLCSVALHYCGSGQETDAFRRIIKVRCLNRERPSRKYIVHYSMNVTTK
jgi:hypothetical protein